MHMRISATHTHTHTHTHTTSRHAHTLCPYYYVLYIHPERDQCYNESRQSVPDASSGPGQRYMAAESEGDRERMGTNRNIHTVSMNWNNNFM